MARPRMTLQTQLVLRELLADPTKGRYGLELVQLVGLPAGTIYPILTRLENEHHWLESWWEQSNHPSRPARRYVRLTPEGVELARTALVETAKSKTAAHLGPLLGAEGRLAW